MDRTGLASSKWQWTMAFVEIRQKINNNLRQSDKHRWGFSKSVFGETFKNVQRRSIGGWGVLLEQTWNLRCEIKGIGWTEWCCQGDVSWSPLSICPHCRVQPSRLPVLMKVPALARPQWGHFAKTRACWLPGVPTAGEEGAGPRQWTLALAEATAAWLFWEGSDSIVQISHCGLSFSLAIGPLSEGTKSMPVTFKRRCRTHWLLGIIELDHIIRNQNTQQNCSAIERLVLPGRNSSYFPLSRWSPFQSNCLSNCFLALFDGKSDCWQHARQVAISTTASETGGTPSWTTLLYSISTPHFWS